VMKIVQSINSRTALEGLCPLVSLFAFMRLRLAVSWSTGAATSRTGVREGLFRRTSLSSASGDVGIG
jgi:hypothetical protein